MIIVSDVTCEIITEYSPRSWFSWRISCNLGRDQLANSEQQSVLLTAIFQTPTIKLAFVDQRSNFLWSRFKRSLKGIATYKWIPLINPYTCSTKMILKLSSLSFCALVLQFFLCILAKLFNICAMLECRILHHFFKILILCVLKWKQFKHKINTWRSWSNYFRNTIILEERSHKRWQQGLFLTILSLDLQMLFQDKPYNVLSFWFQISFLTCFLFNFISKDLTIYNFLIFELECFS
jgi:hypothetical protein